MYAKLDEYDDDNETALDLDTKSTPGRAEDSNRSCRKGIKSLGGDVQSHGLGGLAARIRSISCSEFKSLWASGLSSLKFPECNADKGLAIDNPACRFSFSSSPSGIGDDLISAGGRSGVVRLALGVSCFFGDHIGLSPLFNLSISSCLSETQSEVSWELAPVSSSAVGAASSGVSGTGPSQRSVRMLSSEVSLLNSLYLGPGNVNVGRLGGEDATWPSWSWK